MNTYFHSASIGNELKRNLYARQEKTLKIENILKTIFQIGQAGYKLMLKPFRKTEQKT